MPIKTRLIRGIDTRSLVGILRLKPKLVGQPILAVIRALEFAFVAAARHYREQAVAVGNAKWLQRTDRPERKWRARPNHPQEKDGAGVEEPREHQCGEGEFEIGQVASPGSLPGWHCGFMRGSRFGGCWCWLRQLRFP